MSKKRVDPEDFFWWKQKVGELATEVAGLRRRDAELTFEVARLRQQVAGLMAPKPSVCEGLVDSPWNTRQEGEQLAENVRAISRAAGNAPFGPLLDWLCPPPKFRIGGLPFTMGGIRTMAIRNHAADLLGLLEKDGGS